MLQLPKQQERKTEMNKQLLEKIANCDTCFGNGFLYYGDEETFDIEACICNPESYDGQLFEREAD